MTCVMATDRRVNRCVHECRSTLLENTMLGKIYVLIIMTTLAVHFQDDIAKMQGHSHSLLAETISYELQGILKSTEVSVYRGTMRVW